MYLHVHTYTRAKNQHGKDNLYGNSAMMVRAVVQRKVIGSCGSNYYNKCRDGDGHALCD